MSFPCSVGFKPVNLAFRNWNTRFLRVGLTVWWPLQLLKGHTLFISLTTFSIFVIFSEEKKEWAYSKTSNDCFALPVKAVNSSTPVLVLPLKLLSSISHPSLEHQYIGLFAALVNDSCLNERVAGKVFLWAQLSHCTGSIFHLPRDWVGRIKQR